MRLDKYLKVSRLIKRRTVANEACDAEKVLVNGKVARASYDVKVGDVIEINMGQKALKVKVEQVLEHVLKDDAAGMYTVVEYDLLYVLNAGKNRTRIFESNSKNSVCSFFGGRHYFNIKCSHFFVFYN